jgi:hypothetical protein
MKTFKISAGNILIIFLFIVVVSKACFAQNHILNQNRWGDQEFASMTRLSNGNLAVGWHSAVLGAPGLYFNVFDTNFVPILEYEIPVWDAVLWTRDRIFLAASEDSFFVAAFATYTDVDSINQDIYIRKFANDGSPLSGIIKVNSDTLGDQWASGLRLDDSLNRIYVSWKTTYREDPNLRCYRFRQLGFDLQPQTQEIILLDGSDPDLSLVDFCSVNAETLMAAYYDSYGGMYANIAGSFISTDGSYQSEIFQINSIDSDCQHPALCPINGGGVAAVWIAYDYIYDIATWGRRYSPDLNPIESQEVVLSVPDREIDGNYDIENHPQIAYDTIANVYCLAWSQENYEQSGSFRIRCRFIDSRFAALSDTFTVSEADYAEMPRVTALGNGEFAICWATNFWTINNFDIVATKVRFDPTGISDGIVILPSDISLSAYPNPFNSATTITLAGAEQAEIGIYDITGRLITSLHMVGGQALWDASAYTSGLYFARVAGERATPIKLVLLR